MNETRRTRASIPLAHRVTQAWSIEGFIILASMGLWLFLLFIHQPSRPTFIACLAMFTIGALILALTLDSGSAASQFLFAAVAGPVTFGAAAGVFEERSVNVAVFCASATTLLFLELFRLHELRRRDAFVQPSIFSNGLVLILGIVVVSAAVVFGVTRREAAPLSWAYLPLATLAVFAVGIGVGLWAMSDRSRRSGTRYNPVIVTPPAPTLVDPLVAEAQAATAMRYGASPPPPAPSTATSTKRGRRGR